MLKNWWKTLKAAAVIFGGLLSFLAIIELLRVYQTLYNFHPLAGAVFVILLLFGIISLSVYVAVTLASRPAVLIPPTIAEPDHPTRKELHRYIKYLKRYIGRLSKNTRLTVEYRDKANEGIAELSSSLETQNDLKELLLTIERAENNIISPLLSNLDEQAKRQVRNSTRDVMIAITFSPYKSADLLIVLYRNLLMIQRIIRIYNSRPRFGEQLSTLVDTIRVVATVNFLNMGKTMLERLGSKVPGIGQFLDDITQGIGAGFMTSVAGNAAIERCKAFKGWNAQEAQLRLRNHAAEFFADVKDIFWVDIKLEIRNRIGDVPVNQWNKIKEGIAAVLDETSNVVGKFIREPISKTGKGVAAAGISESRSVPKVSPSTFLKAGTDFRRPGNETYQAVKSAESKSLTPSKKAFQSGRFIRRRKNKNC
jgi:hypothetical protein